MYAFGERDIPVVRTPLNFYHDATAPPPQWAKASLLATIHDHTQTQQTR